MKFKTILALVMTMLFSGESRAADSWTMVKAGECKIATQHPDIKYVWDGNCDSEGYATGIGVLRSYNSDGKLTVISKYEYDKGRPRRPIEYYVVVSGKLYAVTPHRSGEFIVPSQVPSWAQEIVAGLSPTASHSSHSANNVYLGEVSPVKHILIVARNQSKVLGMLERWHPKAPFSFDASARPRIAKEFSASSQHPYFALLTWWTRDMDKDQTAAWTSGATPELAAQKVWNVCKQNGFCRSSESTQAIGTLLIGDTRNAALDYIRTYIPVPGANRDFGFPINVDVKGITNLAAGKACGWHNGDSGPMKLYGDLFFEGGASGEQAPQHRFEFNCKTLR